MRPDEPSLPGLKVRFLLDRLPTTGRVLEIGCGGGKILRTLAVHRPGLELYGCDVREPQEPPDVYTFRRMQQDLPFEADSFDCVLLFDVLEHVPDSQYVLAEASRVLRPGGRLMAFIPIEGERWSFYELFRRLLGRNLYALTKEHVHAFTHEQARSLLEQQFEIAETRYAYHLLGQLFDAAFFAAARAKPLRELWWARNVFYNPKVRNTGGAARLMNAMLVGANAVAAFESTVLSTARATSAGILVDAHSRRVEP